MEAALFVSLSLLAGGLLAVQAGANTQLSKATASPFVATTIQVVIAGTLLLIVAALTGSVVAFYNLSRAPWWHCIGGIATAVYVGQMLASLSLDKFGALGVPLQPLDVVTIVGSLGVFAGAAAIVFDQKAAASELSNAKFKWILLGLLAGAVLPVQGAINGLLRIDIGAPFIVGTISFAVATLSMALVLLVTMAVTYAPKPQLRGLARMPWWGWLGALCGATYVTTVFTAIPVIGTAAAVGLTVAGQQIASLFVDRYGLFRLPIREISSVRLGGVALLLIGVAMIQSS
jgi:transporter family-2 protein